MPNDPMDELRRQICSTIYQEVWSMSGGAVVGADSAALAILELPAIKALLSPPEPTYPPFKYTDETGTWECWGGGGSSTHKEFCYRKVAE